MPSAVILLPSAAVKTGGRGQIQGRVVREQYCALWCQHPVGWVTCLCMTCLTTLLGNTAVDSPIAQIHKSGFRSNPTWQMCAIEIQEMALEPEASSMGNFPHSKTKAGSIDNHKEAQPKISLELTSKRKIRACADRSGLEFLSILSRHMGNSGCRWQHHTEASFPKFPWLLCEKDAKSCSLVPGGLSSFTRKQPPNGGSL